jgi:hypothetical protein
MHCISRAKSSKKKNIHFWTRLTKSTSKWFNFKTNTMKKFRTSIKFKRKRIPEKGKSTSRLLKKRMCFSKNYKNKLLIWRLFWVTGNRLTMINSNRILQGKIKLKVQTGMKRRNEKIQSKFQKPWTLRWIQRRRSQPNQFHKESLRRKMLWLGQGLKSEPTKSVPNKPRRCAEWRTGKCNKSASW